MLAILQDSPKVNAAFARVAVVAAELEVVCAGDLSLLRSMHEIVVDLVPLLEALAVLTGNAYALDPAGNGEVSACGQEGGWVGEWVGVSRCV